MCDWARDFVNSVWLFNQQTSIERRDEIVVHFNEPRPKVNGVIETSCLEDLDRFIA